MVEVLNFWLQTFSLFYLKLINTYMYTRIPFWLKLLLFTLLQGRVKHSEENGISSFASKVLELRELETEVTLQELHSTGNAEGPLLFGQIY